MRNSLCVIITLTVCSLVPVASAGTPAAEAAKKYLAASISDPQKMEGTLSVLRSTADKELTPLFVALSRSGDKAHRMFGAESLPEVAGKDAAPMLLERVQRDTFMLVRAQSLAHLLNLKAITAEQLQEALQIDDENVQCLAARGLVQMGQGQSAAETLQRLTASKDVATAGIARLCLLKMGQTDQLPPLREMFQNAREDEQSLRALSILLEDIQEDKIEGAEELAEAVATQHDLTPLRVRAYRALSAVSPKASEKIKAAIDSTTQNTVFRVQLLNILAGRTDSQAQLEALACAEGTVGVLASFELARKAGGEKGTEAAFKAMALRHPIAIDYVLDRAKKDVEAQFPSADPTSAPAAPRPAKSPADFYVPVLVDYIQSVEPHPGEMLDSHIRAARAATILADLGTAAAMAGLQDILSQKYTAVVRSTGAGLLKTRNPACQDLLRPLLKNPREELVSDAGLLLGRFGNPAAAEYLESVVAHADRQQAAMAVLSCWYVLKLQNQGAAAAEELANLIK